MGVSTLRWFMRSRCPNGIIPINIRDEIRQYYSSVTSPNPPPPIIVVDIKGLIPTMVALDLKGVVCGGRFNEISREMDLFFGELKQLGAQLEFFFEGPTLSISPENWALNMDHRYEIGLKLFRAIDDGKELSEFERFYRSDGRPPFIYVCTLKQMAMKHGSFHWCTTKKSEQEMATYAKHAKALAIMSGNNDLLIYDGPWHLWCTRGQRYLNIKDLTVSEYNRDGLLHFLGLNRSQMPLFSTLAGNDVVNPEALKGFHCSLGDLGSKTVNLARFIRSQSHVPVDSIFQSVLKYCAPAERRTMMNCFKESMDIFQTRHHAFNQRYANDPMETLLLSRNISLFYQIWHSQNIECFPEVTDLRQKQLGEQVPQLKVTLILRMAGIVLYQRQMQRRMVDYSKCNIMVKLRHDMGHAIHQYAVQFPTHVKPPPLEELFSKDPVVCADLRDMKFQLICWIVSDSLDHRRLEEIPKPLQVTVLTLYCLLEKRILEPFEADLFLRVVYDVTNSRYDPQEVAYPRLVGSRPFRVVFVFQQIYSYVAKAFNLVGLNDSLDEDPPFDGVLFHNWYDDWMDHQGDEAKLDEIKEWRLYESIVSDNPKGAVEAED